MDEYAGNSRFEGWANSNQTITELLAERDALEAQNKELTRLLACQEKQTEQLTLIALGETSLAEIRAEAGRVGFVAGYNSGFADRALNRSFSPEWHASGYAHELRQGAD